MTIPSVPLHEYSLSLESTTELHLATVRTQAAIVWAIADALGREGQGERGDRSALREQLAEELARLGCLAIEAAGAMADTCETVTDSGVHAVS